MMSLTVSDAVVVPLGRIATIRSLDGSFSGLKKIAVQAASQSVFSVIVIATAPVVVFELASMPGATSAPICATISLLYALFPS